MPFQSFQSGCGTCNASTDYADIYYSQNPTLASNTVPSGPNQSGAGKKKKRTTSTKKRTSIKKRTSTSTKKRTTKKRTTKKRSMRGGASESSFQLDDQFIRDNLGISFETVGGATYMPPQYYKGGMLDSFRTGTIAGYDANENKYAPLTGGKKKRVTKAKVGKKKTTTQKVAKKSEKKVTKKKSTKKVSKKKTTKKVASSWKLW